MNLDIRLIYCRRSEYFVVTMSDVEDELMTSYSSEARVQAGNGNKQSWLLFQLGALHECTVSQFTDGKHYQAYRGNSA